MDDMLMDSMQMAPIGILGSYPMTRYSSGTSWQPDESMHAAVHGMAGDWMLMRHLAPHGAHGVYPSHYAR